MLSSLGESLNTHRSIDPEKTVAVKTASLAPLPYREGSVYSAVMNPPRPRPGQWTMSTNTT